MANTRIIYWRGSAETRGDLIRALEASGADLRELRSLEEVLDSVAAVVPQLLIVDGSAGEREASNRVVELSSTSPLYSVPIAFLSVQAQKRISALEGRYRRLLALDIPYQLDSALARVAQFIGLDGSEPSASREEAAVQEDSAPIIEPPLVSPVPPTPVVPSPTKNFIVRPHGATSKLGGKRFALAATEGGIPDEAIIPVMANPGVIRDVLERLSQTSPWLGAHARRVAHLSSSLATVLPPGLVEPNNLKAVSLCLNWGFLERQPGLLKFDVFLNGLHGVSDQLADAMNRSASFASEFLDDRARRTLELMAFIVAEQPIAAEEPLVKEAELALAAEFTDRSCWNDGHWSARGAYRAIRRLQDGKPFAVDEQIAWALARILAEAATVHITLESIFNRANAEFGETPEGLNEPEDFEASVPIAIVDLMPGMRLARNVIARDGAVVLKAMTELDEDLIKRLWRLLTIRPLRHPVTVAARLTHA